MILKRIGRPFSTLILSIALTTAATASIATTQFDITTKIYIDGELVSSPRIIARADQKATIKLSNLSMGLIASNASKDAIKINYDVQYNNGSKDAHSKSQVIALPNQPVAISFTTASGHLYDMRLLAKRIV